MLIPEKGTTLIHYYFLKLYPKAGITYKSLGWKQLIDGVVCQCALDFFIIINPLL